MNISTVIDHLGSIASIVSLPAAVITVAASLRTAGIARILICRLPFRSRSLLTHSIYPIA